MVNYHTPTTKFDATIKAHHALQLAINVNGGMSTTVQDAVAQLNHTNAGNREDIPLMRPGAPHNLQGHTLEEPFVERHSRPLVARRNAEPFVTPLPHSPRIWNFAALLPRSCRIWNFAAALVEEEEALLSREQNLPSSPPPYHDEESCARCLEEGHAMFCMHTVSRSNLHIITERLFDVSPLSSVSSASPVSPLNQASSTSRNGTFCQDSGFVVPTAVAAGFFIQADDVLGPRTPRLGPMATPRDLPNFPLL
jgi:hypothetical protein